MQNQPSPRLGCVQYLNAKPLIHGWDGPVDFDHPSVLCRRLAAGELDIALVSSFEYLRNPIYAVVDGLAIASDGPVFSVVLAHQGELEELREIVVDPASETSVNLIRCLFGERNSVVPEFVREGDLTPARGRLYIGDQALRFRAGKHACKVLDLGTAWKELTGLPFVYALWLVHPGYPAAQAVAHKLRSLAARNLQEPAALIAAQPASVDRDFLAFYYRDCLRFAFGAPEKDGFRKFGELCAKQNLLPAPPPDPRLV